MFDVSMFPFQNSIIKAIKFLRNSATIVIAERCLALTHGKETPKDVLEHILNEAKENPDLEMDDLVDNFLTIFIAGTTDNVQFQNYPCPPHGSVVTRIDTPKSEICWEIVPHFYILCYPH